MRNANSRSQTKETSKFIFPKIHVHESMERKLHRAVLFPFFCFLANWAAAPLKQDPDSRPRAISSVFIISKPQNSNLTDKKTHNAPLFLFPSLYLFHNWRGGPSAKSCLESTRGKKDQCPTKACPWQSDGRERIGVSEVEDDGAGDDGCELVFSRLLLLLLILHSSLLFFLTSSSFPLSHLPFARADPPSLLSPITHPTPSPHATPAALPTSQPPPYITLQLHILNLPLLPLLLLL